MNKFKSQITKPMAVAEYINTQLQLCGKPQKKIAEEAGFGKPNIITMIKQGKTNLPIDRIGRFAKALEIDAIHLLKMCLQEYHPENWEEIESIFGQPVLTENELGLLEVIREANVTNPRIRNHDEKVDFMRAVEQLKGDNATAD